MLNEYLEQYYVPAAIEYNRRASHNGRGAANLQSWSERVEREWPGIGAANYTVEQNRSGGWKVSVEVSLGQLASADVSVQLYADRSGFEAEPDVIEMKLVCKVAESGAKLYTAEVSHDRAATDYTPRIIPRNHEMKIPSECGLIYWYR